MIIGDNACAKVGIFICVLLCCIAISLFFNKRKVCFILFKQLIKQERGTAIFIRKNPLPSAPKSLPQDISTRAKCNSQCFNRCSSMLKRE
ncbi:hypothetical protein SC1083_2065 [Aggregatibacter actinomycetemcomitans serotype e str. SC1083]|uniref:Uncharacterized protein n=1 Tax=Aggregatibacter actinomycetemcomitans serotype e str. SC1083 TaxID=907488 RepID=G4AB34_AGGAC|nr:hypothetical protein SC1083_2065 [Aggregatibacter actinomycetemcomitans serotype e str. SC1083]